MTQSPIVSCNQTDNVQLDQRTVLLQVIQESIRQSRQSNDQAHLSFLIATVMTTVSTMIGLAGAALLLIGNASEGSVTTAVGVASGVYSYQLSKEAADRQKHANERLDQILEQLHTIDS